jgi:hypothetical protein
VTLPDTDKLQAACDLLGRTGVRQLRLAHTPEEDGTPVVWYCAGMWLLNAAGRPAAVGIEHHEATAAMSPVEAALRLCEEVIDGGLCQQCHRMTIFDPNVSDTPFDALLRAAGCVYGWDPELGTFRRGCEGDT